MKISSVKISKPIVAYDLEVRHFATRKATAIEWAILETINLCSNNSKYANVSSKEVFEDILCIRDVDYILKPIINDLIGHGMILVDDHDGLSTFSDMMISKFSLTELGDKLRVDGHLPGKKLTDAISILFDPEDSELSLHMKKLTQDKAGVSLVDFDSSNLPIPPSGMLLDYINELKTYDTYGWLNNSTVIEDIDIKDSNLFWKNYESDISIDDNLNLSVSHIQNLQNIDISKLGFAIDKSVKIINDSLDDSLRELLINFSKEKELLRKYTSANVEVINTCNDKYKLFVKPEELKSLFTICVHEGDSYTDFNEKQIIVYISKDLYNPNFIYLNSNNKISVENFNIKINSNDSLATFIAVRSVDDIEFCQLIDVISKKCYKCLPVCLLGLLFLGKNQQFLELFYEIYSGEKNNKEKEILLCNIVCLLCADSLLDKVDNSSTIDILQRLCWEYIINSEGDMPNRLSKFVDTVKSCGINIDDRIFINSILMSFDSPFEYKKLCTVLNVLKSHFEELSHLIEKNTLRNIYSNSTICEILSLFYSDRVSKDSCYTDVEESIYRLKSLTDDFSEKFSNFYNGEGSEFKIEDFSKKDMKELVKIGNSSIECIDFLKDICLDTNAACFKKIDFSKTYEQIIVLINTLNSFTEDKTIKSIKKKK